MEKWSYKWSNSPSLLVYIKIKFATFIILICHIFIRNNIRDQSAINRGDKFYQLVYKL